MNTELEILLRKMGLSPSQVSIYCLLVKSPKTVKELMVNLDYGRSTIVESLIELELLELIYSDYLMNSKTKIYYAKGARSLSNMVDKKIIDLEFEKDRLAESKRKISNLVGFELGSFSGFDATSKLYLGKKEIANAYRSTIEVERIYSICRLDDYYSVFPGGLSIQSQANRLSKKRVFRDLIIDGESVKSLEVNKQSLDYSNYDYKIIQDSQMLKESSFTDILITDNYTIFSSFKEKIPYSVKLNSPQISKFLIYFHNIIWENV